MELLNLDLRKLCGLSVRERFDESYVPVTESGCWIWLGKTGGKANGRFMYGKIYMDGKYRPAHRVSYQLHNGPLSDDDVVMHLCDTTLCVNPRHLRKGTQGDNVRDCITKGRRVLGPTGGVRNGRAKLTDADVAAILSDDRSLKVIGDDFGISDTHVLRVKRRENWRDVVLMPPEGD
jgi:hypothetical protein